MKAKTNLVIIVRDFRGTNLWLTSFTLGASPTFTWSADRSKALKVASSAAFGIMAATSAYGAEYQDGNMLAIDAKGNLLQAGTRQLASVSAERKSTFDARIAAGKIEAYNDATRAARLIGRGLAS